MTVSKKNRLHAGPRGIGLMAGALMALAGGSHAKADAPADREASTVTGDVSRFTTAPKGEIDGAVLDSGTVIHWPPHLGSQIADVIHKGDQVRAQGANEAGPEGDRHFEIRKITNVGSNAAVDVGDVPPPRPRAPRDSALPHVLATMRGPRRVATQGGRPLCGGPSNGSQWRRVARWMEPC